MLKIVKPKRRKHSFLLILYWPLKHRLYIYSFFFCLFLPRITATHPPTPKKITKPSSYPSVQRCYSYSLTKWKSTPPSLPRAAATTLQLWQLSPLRNEQHIYNVQRILLCGITYWEKLTQIRGTHLILVANVEGMTADQNNHQTNNEQKLFDVIPSIRH